MNTKLVIKNTDSSEIIEENILSFTFRKEVYLPYSVLNANICTDSAAFNKAAEVLFYLNGKLIHHGLADDITVTTRGRKNITAVSSRSFTSLLSQNQIEPGLKENVSIRSLMSSYTFPNITYEDNSGNSSYIYVSGKSTIWDSIVNLSYKLYETYPYIRETNKVMIKAASDPLILSYSDDEVLSSGSETNTKRLISNFHMADPFGSYGQYELSDSEVQAEKIVRHKFFELDMEFLQEPQRALEYRSKYAARGWKRSFFSYSGYKGEDLSDIVSYGGIQSERVAAVRIKGSSKGVITEISVYRDKFLSY